MTVQMWDFVSTRDFLSRRKVSSASRYSKMLAKNRLPLSGTPFANRHPDALESHDLEGRKMSCEATAKMELLYEDDEVTTVDLRVSKADVRLAARRARLEARRRLARSELVVRLALMISRRSRRYPLRLQNAA